MPLRRGYPIPDAFTHVIEGEGRDLEIADGHLVSRDLAHMDVKGMRLDPAAVDPSQPLEVISKASAAYNKEVLLARLLLVLAGEDQGHQVGAMVRVDVRVEAGIKVLIRHPCLQHPRQGAGAAVKQDRLVFCLDQEPGGAPFQGGDPSA